MSKIQKTAAHQNLSSLPLVLMVMGILLIAASFIPFGNGAAKAMWAREDSAKLAIIRQEYHDSNYLSPARQGLSQQELDEKLRLLKTEQEALEQKLSTAKNQPKLWSRYLLWAGAILVASAALWQRRYAT